MSKKLRLFTAEGTGRPCRFSGNSVRGVVARTIGGLLAIACAAAAGEPPRASQAEKAAATSHASETETLVRELVRLSSKEGAKERGRFCSVLATIARDRGWPDERLSRKWLSQGGGPRQARAVRVSSDKTPYVVVILSWRSVVIPGDDMEELMLLDVSGNKLDILSCTVSSRLEVDGSFRTIGTLQSERDGANFVIRYEPDGGGPLSGNFGHDIVHGKQRASYGWERAPQGLDGATFAKKGLCRVAVRDARLHVLFPPMKKKQKQSQRPAAIDPGGFP